MAREVDAALLEAGEKLLNGWGYNWYRRENLARADDQLIRNRADALLGDVLAAFRRAEAAFRSRHLAAPTREQPLPAQASPDQLHAFQAMMAEVEAFRARLRGAALLPAEKIAYAAAAEAGLLDRLSACDVAVVGLVQSLRAEALAMTPAAFATLPAMAEPRLSALRDALETREKLLIRP